MKIRIASQRERAAVLVLVAFFPVLTACEPVRFADLAVTPRPVPAADSTAHGDAFAIAERIASQYRLERFAADDLRERSWTACYGRGHLILCGKAHGPDAHFQIRRYGAGTTAELDTLRESLTRELQARFGDDAVGGCTWRLVRDSDAARCVPPPRVAVGDSVRGDTLPRDTITVDVAYPEARHDPLLFPALAAATAVILVVPSAALALMVPVDTTESTFWEGRVSAYVTGGFSWQEEQEGVQSANVELLWNGIYGAVRVENFELPRHFQYQSVRGGYLLHPKRGVAGGVTVGYRRAPQDRSHQGVEIGFPVFTGSRKGTLRLEPTYVFAPGGVSWNYRFQGDYPISGGPLFFGLCMEAKTVRMDRTLFRRVEPFTSAFALVLGARL